MRKTFLEKNPFYILEVSPGDKRATIISKVEEKAFFTDGNECEEAQTSLLSPSKRLPAEIDWFLECDASMILGIRSSIENHTAIKTDNLSGLAELNATLYNFEISTLSNYFEIGSSILKINEQYIVIEPDTLTYIINNYHTKAGLIEVSESEIERELNKKREQIRHLISEKTAILDEDAYIRFATMLAEKCITDYDYSDSIIIADVLDQYELNMQTLIESVSSGIISHIERIQKMSQKEGIEANLTGLINKIGKWDKLVQPLQIKSMLSGVAHETSEKIGREIRELSVWLHNEKEMSQQALMLTNSMKPIFAEIGNLSEAFENDADTLNEILNQGEGLEQIIVGIKDVERIVAGWQGSIRGTDSHSFGTNGITKSSVDDLIEKVKSLNAQIKSTYAPEEIVIQLRKGLCILARAGAIYAHNECDQTELAYSITKVLLTEFEDISELKLMLLKDSIALGPQVLGLSISRASQASSATQTSQVSQTSHRSQTSQTASEPESNGWIGCFVYIIVMAIIAMIAANA